MRKLKGWIPVLTLAAMVAALGSEAWAQSELAPRDRNRIPALLLTDPATGLTDRWESDGFGAAAVSIKSGAMGISGPVTVTQGAATVITAPWPVILSDGSAALGTGANPLRMDPTGSTTQPVSGTVTSNIGTTGGLALEATLASVLAKLSADPSTETTLAAILAKILAAPATEAKQDTGNTSLASIAAEDFATQTTLAAVLAKILAAPATEAKQDTGNTSLSNIDTNTTGLAGTVSGSEQQVDVVTLPALAAGTNLIGSVASADRTDAIMDGTTSLTPKFAIIDFSGAGDNTVVAAVPGNKIRVLSGLLIAGGNVNVRFESGASGTALTGQMQLTSNSGFNLPYSPVGSFETGVNTLLNLETSSAQSVDGFLVYVEVP